MPMDATHNNEPTLDARIEKALSTLCELIERNVSLIAKLSGGKDSLTVTILMLRAVEIMCRRGRNFVHHYVSSSSTTVESPPMEKNLFGIHDEIATWSAAKGLPVEIRTVRPSLASQFVVATIGQGRLPRTPQTSQGGKRRSCSHDWKVYPQVKLAREIERQALQQTGQRPVGLIGTRFDESRARAANMSRRNESAQEPKLDEHGQLVLSLIADWPTDDVWMFLARFYNGTAPFESFSPHGSCMRKTVALYKDAHDGSCVIGLGDGGNRAPCGPRWGCTVCTLVSGKDKSMDSMLATGTYDYMRGLAALRNYLYGAVADLGKREMIGRSRSDAGCIQVALDNFSYVERVRLLRHMLTLDVLEEERAQALHEQVERGMVEASDEVLELCEPQFQLIDAEKLMAIDLYLSLHFEAPHAFPAIHEWFAVRSLGRRYPLPLADWSEQPLIPPVPAAKWFKVGNFDAEVPTDGLRCYEAESWNRYWHPGRPTFGQTPSGERTVYFQEQDALSVDGAKACELLLTFSSLATPSCDVDALAGASYLLNEGVVSLAKGHVGDYHEMARRAQYFKGLMHKLNLTPDGLRQWVRAHSITAQEHDALLQRAKATEEHVQQLDLLGDLIS